MPLLFNCYTNFKSCSCCCYSVVTQNNCTVLYFKICTINHNQCYCCSFVKLFWFLSSCYTFKDVDDHCSVLFWYVYDRGGHGANQIKGKLLKITVYMSTCNLFYFISFYFIMKKRIQNDVFVQFNVIILTTYLIEIKFISLFYRMGPP